MWRDNKKIVYLPDLEVSGDIPYLASDFYKQQMRWAYGVVSSYILHFKDLLKSKQSLLRKMTSMLPGIGYLISPLICLLLFFGAISFATHAPAPMDIPRFLRETGYNILITSGLIVASAIALFRAKKFKYSLKMLVSSFSVGLVGIYYVNKGIIKCFLGKHMDWFLVKKDVCYKK